MIPPGDLVPLTLSVLMLIVFATVLAKMLNKLV
jgi:hypothetical protein